MGRFLLAAMLLIAPAAYADLTPAAWNPVGFQDFELFGASVAPAGDVNRDGYGDVLVGAPGHSETQSGEGRVYLYLGGPNGLAASPAWAWSPGEELAAAGTCVAAAGDVNGDGVDDFLVGAPNWDSPFGFDAGGVFVFLGATQEAAYQRGRSAVAGRVVKDAMISRFEVLRPQDSLGRAAELLLATHQHDFPVLDAWDRVAGILPRVRLLEALAREGSAAPVLDVMQRDPVVVAPDTPLDAVLPHVQADPARPLLVVDGGKLVGMLTLENLSEFIVIAQRLPSR